MKFYIADRFDYNISVITLLFTSYFLLSFHTHHYDILMLFRHFYYYLSLTLTLLLIDTLLFYIGKTDVLGIFHMWPFVLVLSLLIFLGKWTKVFLATPIQFLFFHFPRIGIVLIFHLFYTFILIALFYLLDIYIEQISFPFRWIFHSLPILFYYFYLVLKSN